MVWECDECGFRWMPKVGSDGVEVLPKQCASKECRSRRWNQKGDGGVKAVTVAQKIGSGSGGLEPSDDAVPTLENQAIAFAGTLSGDKAATTPEEALCAAPEATAPGQVDLGTKLDPEKNRRAAAPPSVDTKARQSGATLSTLKTTRAAKALHQTVALDAVGPALSGGVGKASVETLHNGDGIPLELCGLQPTVADTYGGITRGDGPVQNSVDAAEKSLREVEESKGWTEDQWDHYYETHRINPATGAQYPNKEFCSLRESDSCNRYNTGGHCLMCR